MIVYCSYSSKSNFVIRNAVITKLSSRNMLMSQLNFAIQYIECILNIYFDYISMKEARTVVDKSLHSPLSLTKSFRY